MGTALKRTVVKIKKMLFSIRMLSDFTGLSNLLFYSHRLLSLPLGTPFKDATNAASQIKNWVQMIIVFEYNNLRMKVSVCFSRYTKHHCH